MNKKTLQALQGSIEKWQQIVDSTEAEDKEVDNCPLCGMFWNRGCRGCPVSAVTGRSGCIGSPYAEWSAHTNSHAASPARRCPGCKECLRLARAELAFLVGLLPNKAENQGAQP